MPNKNTRFNQQEYDDLIAQSAELLKTIDSETQRLEQVYHSDEWDGQKFESYSASHIRLDKMNKDVERMQKRLSYLDSINPDINTPAGPPNNLGEALKVFNQWTKSGCNWDVLSTEDRNEFQSDIDPAHFHLDFKKLGVETPRLDSVASDAAGGSGFIETQVRSPISHLKNYGGGHQYMSSMTTDNGRPFQVPNLDDSDNEGAIGKQGANVGDQNLADPTLPVLAPLSIGGKGITAQLEMERDAPFNWGMFIVNHGFRRCGRALAKEVATGSGASGNMLGFVPGANLNYNMKANSTPDLNSDEIIKWLATLDTAYLEGREEGPWGFDTDIESGMPAMIFNVASYWALLRAKDAENRPLFMVDWSMGSISRLVGLPVARNASMESSVAANKVAAVAGDFSCFMIRMTTDMYIHRIIDSVTGAKNQVKYHVFVRADARPVGATKLSGGLLKTDALATLTWK